MRSAPRVIGGLGNAVSPFRGAAREPASLREFERRAARRPGDQQASGPVPGDPALLRSSAALFGSAQQHEFIPQLPLAARAALSDFRRHQCVGSAGAAASLAGSACSLDACSTATAGPAALHAHDDITSSPFCDPGTLPQFNSLISEIQQRRELAARERLAGCSGQHSLLPLPRPSITIGDAAIALIKSEPPSVPCARGPGSGTGSQSYRSPFGLPCLPSSTGAAAGGAAAAAAALPQRRELLQQQPASEAASPTHPQQTQQHVPWACSWPAAQPPQASWEQQEQQAAAPPRASKAATAAGKKSGGRRRAQHAAAAAPSNGVQKKKVHSSTRMRQRLSDLTQQHEDLLHLAGALESANALLRQRWQRLSADFDAAPPSLGAPSCLAAEAGADLGLQQLALAMQAPDAQQAAALAGAMQHSWDTLAGQLAAVLPDLETLPPQHTLRQPSCGSLDCDVAGSPSAQAAAAQQQGEAAGATSSNASLDDLGPFASAAAAAAVATAAAGSDAADALLRLSSSARGCPAAAKAPAQKRHRRTTPEELSLLFSSSLSLDAPMTKMGNRNCSFRQACSPGGAVPWPASPEAAATSSAPWQQQRPMVSPFSMVSPVGCFATTPLARALGLLDNARGLAAQVAFSSAAAGSATGSVGSGTTAPAQHWQQVVASLQLAPAQVAALQQLWAELQADHQRSHAARQALCSALADERCSSGVGSMPVAAYGTCGAGMAALAAAEDLTGQLQATLAADWSRLAQVYEQLLGEQSPLSFVQQVRLVVEAWPCLPDYCLIEALTQQRTA